MEQTPSRSQAAIAGGRTFFEIAACAAAKEDFE
jgi:hypothetical protein